MLLPILIPVFGVCTPSWAQSWWNARTLAGLPVQGVIKGALQPAPSRIAKGEWTSRPLSSYELSALLRDYLECPDDPLLSSHSLKSTILSWGSKCEMPREYRRVLGRHSSSVKDSDSVYARELSFAPVRAMERMFNLIRKSEFNPDAPRSKFFPEAPEPGAAPVFPPTPAFHASVAAPSTPAEKLAHQPSVEPSFSNEAPLEVKQEDELILKTPSEQKEVSDLVEAISSSEDESDSSGAESGLSSTDDDIESDPEVVEVKGLKFPTPNPKGESPSINEVWMQHVHLKTVHIVEAGAGSIAVTKCGRKCSDKMASVALDEAAFNLFAQATLGAMANLGDTAVLKRLLFESHTLVLAQLKQQVTDPDGSSSRKMPPVEREARMENLKLRLPGVVIQRQMEPSHSLLDLCIQQWETRQLKFLSPEKCISRQWEIEMSKGSKQIDLDSDKLLVKEKSDVPDCVAHTELQTFEALRRRGIALAFADIVSWESHEAYLMALFANLQKSPPQNYVKSTLQQVLRADRAVFTKLIQDGTPVRRAADGTLPLDTALIAALNHPDAAYHLMPLPKPASAPPKADPPKNEFRYNDQWDNHRYSTWERTSFHKRKGKGKRKRKVP
eukprot:symbB.v1.2.023834.t1/scaffold2208.1/size85765/3